MKNNSFWKFKDSNATFKVENPQDISFLYLPLANEAETMSSITPLLKGDIKTSNHSFLMLPQSRLDLMEGFSSRNFWIYLNDKKKAWPLAQTHATDPKDKLTLEAGLLYHKLTKNNSSLGLEAEILNFVPVTDDQVEIMVVKVTNISNKKVKITPTSAIPIFARSADNLRDHHQVTSLLHRIKQHPNGVVVDPIMIFDERGNRLNKTSYFVLGIDGDKNPIGSFPTLDSFIGEGKNLGSPKVIFDNLSPAKLSEDRLNGKEAIGAIRFATKTLNPGQSAEIILVLGMTNNKGDINKILSRFNTKIKINKALEDVKKFWKNKTNSLSFNTNDSVFDNWLRWVSTQPALRKIFGCSFLPDFDYGKGGRGWRDLWQDCLALLLNDSKDIKPLMIANFSGIRIDGSNATIITKKPGHFTADRNKVSRTWMDHGIWPFFTLELYINQTKDLSILLEKTPYYKDAQILRAKEIDKDWDGSPNLKTKSGKVYKGTLLEHTLVQHLAQFFNVGAHNCIRLECADWNDGLDMAMEKGESVAFSCFYAYNLGQIASTLEKLKQTKGIKYIELFKEARILLDSIQNPVNYNSFKSKIALLNKYLAATKNNISGEIVKVNIDELIKDLKTKAAWLSNHIRTKEWININSELGLFNGYYDNKSRRVEGKQNNNIRMTLTGQVYPILSGIATDVQIKKIFKSAKKLLYDKKLKGFRLNTDFGSPQFDLGRAFAFSYGEKENGAIFSHMCVMFSYALYKRGFAKEGFEVLNSLYELASNSNISKIYPNLPEYFNLEGRGMYSYLTGSASWFIMTLLTEVFGVKGEFGDLRLSPKLVKEQFKHSSTISTHINFAGKRINISYQNRNKKDYPHYSIKNISSNISCQRINAKEIILKRNSITSAKSNQINIDITLG